MTPPVTTLGELIKRARETRKNSSGKHWTQEELAGQVFTSKQWISCVESGKCLPSFELLVKLHTILTATETGEPPVPLRVWLLKWLDAQARSAEHLDQQTKHEIQTALDQAAGALGRPFSARQPNSPRSLSDFPLSFEPLTIICGDRREDPPRTRGDIFAYSVSITDVTFLLRLGIPSDSIVIKSDKLFAWMDDERLKQEFGKTNLLIIGSPSVNLAARRINNLAVFQFALDAEMKEWEEQLRHTKELNDRQNLEKFWRIARDRDWARDPEAVEFEKLVGSDEDDNLASRERVKKIKQIAKDLLKGNKAAYWMNRFRKPGFMDPIDGVVHGLYTREDNDFGLISLARNPFSENTDYVCIYVAGIHGPGTAHALRVLARPDNFKDHPFGGIIEVELDLLNKDMPNRFEKAHWKWQTGHYTPASLAAILEEAVRPGSASQDGFFSHWTKEELHACLSFVRAVSNAVPTPANSAPARPPRSGAIG